MTERNQEDNKRCFVSYGPPDKVVGNVDENSYPDLRSAFCQYGTIVNIDYIETKPIAFVEFSTSEAASFAIYNLNGRIHQGRELTVSWAKTKDENDRRHKKDGEEGEKKEKKDEKKEEKKVTEIERPETPIGGLRVDSDVEKPKKKKRGQKNKNKPVVREIQYPSVETPSTPPQTPPQTQTQTNQTKKTKQTKQNKQNQETQENQEETHQTQSTQNQNQKNKNQNTGGKKNNQNNQNTQNNQQNKNQNTGGKKKGRQQNYEIIVRNIDTDDSSVVAVLTDNGVEITDQHNFDRFLLGGLGLTSNKSSL